MIIPEIQETAEGKLEFAKDEGAWFEIKGGGRLRLRLLDSEDIKAMRNACIKKNVEYPLLGEKYQRFENQEIDEDLWNQMLWDRTILDWEGILDAKERPIPVTAENKVLLMEHVPVVIDAYGKGLKALKDADKQKQEELEKNS